MQRSEYKSDHPERGVALVISNETFVKSSRREGTEVDVTTIQETLESLSFQVIVERNMKAKEMKELLQKYADKDHSESDCFLCVIMSHGGYGVVSGVDEQTISYSEITKPFTRSETLVGKPKLFFIQACRGDLEMDRMNNRRHDASRESSDATFLTTDSTSCSSTIIPPREADVLIHYATVEGFVSWRNETRGTWFIQSLIEALRELSETEHIVTITTRVNNKVANMKGNTARQMPQRVDTLRKDFYLRQVRDGYRKQYSNGELKYEGEFKDGKWDGKGKEYYDDGQLKYEGEFKIGKYDGKGKKYQVCGKLWYEGEFKIGKYDGKGKWYLNGKLVYEGEYKNGIRDGKVKEYHWDGKLKYEGEFKNGRMDGMGKEYYENGQLLYEGEYKNGWRNGKGKEYYFDGELKYEGEFKNNKWHGKGKEYWSGQLMYEGEYKDGKWDGKGKQYYSWGGKLWYEGEFKDGKWNGKGKEYLRNGELEYEGEYKNGLRDGKGKEYYFDGELKYEGEFKENKYIGP